MGEQVSIQPHRPASGLAHFRAGRGGEQRGGEAIQLQPMHAPAQLQPVDDVAPLVRSAHLQHAAMALVQLHEIIGLKDHVVEFEEGERLLTLQPQLHGIEGEHAVDGEMRPHLAQHGDIFQLVQPIGIVDELGAGIEIKEGFKHPADGGDIGVDLLFGEHLARFILAGRIADLGGAAAHERNGVMPRALQGAQHHDGEQMAGMQAGSGGIKADIGGDRAGRCLGVECLKVRALVNIAALMERAHEF